VAVAAVTVAGVVMGTTVGAGAAAAAVYDPLAMLDACWYDGWEGASAGAFSEAGARAEAGAGARAEDLSSTLLIARGV
jgi:hypothetical protein